MELLDDENVLPELYLAKFLSKEISRFILCGSLGVFPIFFFTTIGNFNFNQFNDCDMSPFELHCSESVRLSVFLQQSIVLNCLVIFFSSLLFFMNRYIS